MSFDPAGYVLGEHAGDAVWFLDSRMTVVFLPRDIPHAFLVTTGPLRGLQITAPAGFERFIHELGRPAQGLGLPEPTQPDIPWLMAASQKHGYQIIGPPLSLPGVPDQFAATRSQPAGPV